MSDPISSLFGYGPVRCKRLGPDIAMHWFAADAAVGDTCVCGETTKTEDS